MTDFTDGYNIGLSLLQLLAVHVPTILQFWSQWPRGLTRGSASACLLGLRVRIPSGAWMSVSVLFGCCRVELTVTSWSLVQRSPAELGVSEYDPGTSQKLSRSTRAVESWQNKLLFLNMCTEFYCWNFLSKIGRLWVSSPPNVQIRAIFITKYYSNLSCGWILPEKFTRAISFVIKVPNTIH